MFVNKIIEKSHSKACVHESKCWFHFVLEVAFLHPLDKKFQGVFVWWVWHFESVNENRELSRWYQYMLHEHWLLVRLLTITSKNIIQIHMPSKQIHMQKNGKVENKIWSQKTVPRHERLHKWNEEWVSSTLRAVEWKECDSSIMLQWEPYRFFLLIKPITKVEWFQWKKQIQRNEGKTSVLLWDNWQRWKDNAVETFCLENCSKFCRGLHMPKQFLLQIWTRIQEIEREKDEWESSYSDNIKLNHYWIELNIKTIDSKGTMLQWEDEKKKTNPGRSRRTASKSQFPKMCKIVFPEGGLRFVWLDADLTTSR